MAEADGGSGESGSKKILIIIIVLLLLIGGAGNGAYFLFFKSVSEEEASVGEITYPVFTPPISYTINLRDGRHFLKISLVTVLDGDYEVLYFLADQSSLVEDMVTSLISHKTAEDLRTLAGTDLLKQELLKKTNNLLPQELLDKLESGSTQPIKKILFKEFLIM
jgi:flagellar protein FliL